MVLLTFQHLSCILLIISWPSLGTGQMLDGRIPWPCTQLEACWRADDMFLRTPLPEKKSLEYLGKVEPKNNCPNLKKICRQLQKCIHSLSEESSPAWPLLSDSTNMTKCVCVPCHLQILSTFTLSHYTFWPRALAICGLRNRYWSLFLEMF